MRTGLRSRGQRILRELLVEIRDEAGFTQAALARIMSVQQSYVAKIETGERNVNPAECYEWADACNVDPTEFFARFCARVRRDIHARRGR
jgi:transcriptional regulator with XRE-family HTH domain